MIQMSKVTYILRTISKKKKSIVQQITVFTLFIAVSIVRVSEITDKIVTKQGKKNI